MSIKTLPVPIDDQAPVEKIEEPQSEEPKILEEPPKKKRRTKAEVQADKAQKAAAKLTKEEERANMKARVKCPVCRKMMSQWTYLYNYECWALGPKAQP